MPSGDLGKELIAPPGELGLLHKLCGSYAKSCRTQWAQNQLGVSAIPYRVVKTDVGTNHKGRDTGFLPSQKNRSLVAINLMSKHNSRPTVKTGD